MTVKKLQPLAQLTLILALPALACGIPAIRAQGINSDYVDGSIIGSSDRNLKENFVPVKPLDVLAKVAALPITEWNFKRERSMRHIGPMAQDFYAAFKVGPDDKHIATVDAGGVALAAIQGLNQKLEAAKANLKDSLEQREARLTKLEERLAELEAKLQSISSRLSDIPENTPAAKPQSK